MSCETDVDLNADYQDITIVYGLIDPNDTVHYLKINKAFLGETNVNANDLAAIESNFNYAADELDVTVEEYNKQNDLVTTHTTIRTVNEIPKDPGIFDNSTNVLYKFITTSINRDNTFKLKIYNAKENKEIEAETKIVKKASVDDPSPTAKWRFWASSEAVDEHVVVSTKPDMGRVQCIVQFNYIEHYTTASGKPSVEKTVEMNLGEIKTTTSLGGESMEWILKGETFFDNIVSGVPSPSSIADFSHRELDNISMQFNVAGTELSTYMEVEAPSTSVNQDKPNYTNLSNAIGIFSSREIMLWESTIDPQTQNQVNLHNETITRLQSLNLGFCFGTTGVGFPVAPCVQL
ncbi:MAG: hypothetical protein KDD41_08635 [Flavobacteriales bacterium]|nr:hypothetical protein [Flavobacteriales bacterium]